MAGGGGRRRLCRVRPRRVLRGRRAARYRRLRSARLLTDREAVIELLDRRITPDEYEEIRELWKRHSIAEDERDLPGLISTLTEDCVYEIAGTEHAWHGHEGAARFYTELLTAFPDIDFALRNIVIGPQGVCEEADVTATHERTWLDRPATGGPVSFTVVIFFPWDRRERKFSGERVFVETSGSV